jgi:hypothetical protein
MITNPSPTLRFRSAGGPWAAALLLATFVALATPSATTPPNPSQDGCAAVPFADGLQVPLGITQSGLGNLLIAESGSAAPNTGRLSIVDRRGGRRTLLDGLPSAINDVGEPSGPAGLAMRGRTVYVAIGVGDVGRPGPLQGTTVPNPSPVSSPLFSSVLAVRFSARVEQATDGFTLSPDDHDALAAGESVSLSHGRGESVTITRVVDFPDFVAQPLPFFAGNVRLSNPFALVERGGWLYVTDGGRNLVWEVDVITGGLSALTTFPAIANPVAPFGPPSLDAVPTGIAGTGHGLLVTLFRGFPFPPGTSTVEQIGLDTGASHSIVSGQKTLIGVQPIDTGGRTGFLVLQHVTGAPGPPQSGGPGRLLHVEAPGAAPEELVDCLERPTAMTWNARTRTVYITELHGAVVSFTLARDRGRSRADKR